MGSCPCRERRVCVVLLWGKDQSSAPNLGRERVQRPFPAQETKQQGNQKLGRRPAQTHRRARVGTRGQHSGPVWASCPQGGRGFLPMRPSHSPPEPPSWGAATASQGNQGKVVDRGRRAGPPPHWV